MSNEFIGQMNRMGAAGVPFIFLVDFEQEKPVLCEVTDARSEGILFQIGKFTNAAGPQSRSNVELTKFPISLFEYNEKFEYVLSRLFYGDSFLTNLTIKTEIRTNRTLYELFHTAQAKYKLLFKDQFLVFSPETFVKIREGKIYTFPMKGTMDASEPLAREQLLLDPKELAEHVTIVDLMRNDLSRVARQVHVNRFRYIEELRTTGKTLLQVSSEIEGVLSSDYRAHLGSIINELLPAGSITGAPKEKTVRIIMDAEKEKRGYYTGVFGYFDGYSLESAVMIRYIERQSNTLFYRSGGGVTTQSTAELEYQEAIDKIYVPLD